MLSTPRPAATPLQRQSPDHPGERGDPVTICVPKVRALVTCSRVTSTMRSSKHDGPFLGIGFELALESGTSYRGPQFVAGGFGVSEGGCAATYVAVRSIRFADRRLPESGQRLTTRETRGIAEGTGRYCQRLSAAGVFDPAGWSLLATGRPGALIGHMRTFPSMDEPFMGIVARKWRVPAATRCGGYPLVVTGGT
jgi:hypothetical protein